MDKSPDPDSTAETTSTDLVPASSSEPPAEAGPSAASTEASTPGVDSAATVEPAAKTEPLPLAAASYTQRAAQHAGSLGINPETVIIQPPAPPPASPTGRADENSVTKAELAEQLQTSQRTIDRWVAEGVLPAPVRQGRGRMPTRFQADAALLYWKEQGEEARKERRHRQRNRRNLPQESLTRESRSRRNRRPGGTS